MTDLKPDRIQSLLAVLAVFLMGGCALAPQQEAETLRTAEVARTYYAALAGKEELAEIPMANDLHFESPRFALDSAVAFRKALSQLVSGVKSLEIRHQLVKPGVAITLYQLDLGAPGGPIPMAERLQIVEGRLVDVQLIFDASRLPAPPSS